MRRLVLIIVMDDRVGVLPQNAYEFIVLHLSKAAIMPVECKVDHRPRGAVDIALQRLLVIPVELPVIGCDVVSDAIAGGHAVDLGYVEVDDDIVGHAASFLVRSRFHALGGMKASLCLFPVSYRTGKSDRYGDDIVNNRACRTLRIVDGDALAW